ncbi:MAG: hypothetical protein ACTSQJ_19110 [Promethearchaeota archaeon]
MAKAKVSIVPLETISHTIRFEIPDELQEILNQVINGELDLSHNAITMRLTENISESAYRQ